MDAKLKHLEFIQSVINRMASNSATLKGWSITLVAALFALAAKDINRAFVIIAYLPVITFWILDGYYLCKERGYRELYKEVARKPESEIDFSMDISSCTEKHYWEKAIFSSTVTVFYLSLIVVMVIIMFLIIK